MESIKEYHSLQDKIASLTKKNSELSKKCEEFRSKTAWITENRDNLKAKHKIDILTSKT